jgi:ATP-dependent Clp protease protease subunit
MKRGLFNRRNKVQGLVVENGEGDDAKVMVYDEISSNEYFGVSSKAFINALDGIDAKRIHVHINSPGGDVFAGLAIANAIQQHPARIITHVDALAASIASIIAIAGDFVRMSDNAFLMIHDPFTFAIGNASELRKQADLLDKVQGTLANEYVKRTGENEKQVKDWMSAETWFSAAEAKEYGFIDSVDGSSAAPTDAFDLSVFNRTPQPLLSRDVREPSVRDAESALRDVGYSQNDARKIVSIGIAALHKKQPPRDEADTQRPRDEGKNELAQMIAQLTTTLK